MEIIIGSLIAVVITILIENWRKPNLQLTLAPPTDIKYDEKKSAQSARFVKLELSNKPLPIIARWMMRNAAQQCHGFITFHHLDGQKVFERSMPIRWTSAPEPVAMKINMGQNELLITDPSKFTMEPRVDIYPGEYERLNIAAKFDNEDQIYGWCNENYFSNPPWKNPKWKLEKDRYLVNVTILSSGIKYSKIFRLVGNVTKEDFRLENAQKTDKIFD